MEFDFTIDDLRAYLAAKQDDEVVGYCADASGCLIAQAVQAKYAGRIEVCVDAFEMRLVPAGVCLPLPPVFEAVTQAFDSWAGKRAHEPVTKAEFLRAWHECLAFRAQFGGEMAQESQEWQGVFWTGRGL